MITLKGWFLGCEPLTLWWFYKEESRILSNRHPIYFNLLLGCPWLHEYREVPSTSHQKVKALEGTVFIIEEDYLCTTITHRGPVVEIELKWDDEEFYGVDTMAMLEKDKAPLDFSLYFNLGANYTLKGWDYFSSQSNK